MRQSSAELLEFAGLKELLARYVASPFGLAELEKVEPASDREWLETVLADTAEAVRYVRAGSQPQQASRGAALPVRFTALPDSTAAVQKLRIEGAVLEGREIFDLMALLDSADDIRSVLTSVTVTFPRLAAKASRIGDFRAVRRELDGKILANGTVADTASVALNRLRRDIERQQRLIQESLERFLRVHHEDGILQEEYVTLRNDRFVVPIVSGQRRKVDGVIHGASGTGRTLFVEPLETIDLNNELVRLKDEELREVHRILRELTELLRLQAGAIAATLDVMGELELLFAKAHFAADFDATIPRISPDDQRRLVLREARHPLLEDLLRRQGRLIVPISLGLDEQTTLLLVSGPNTGGKTVALKTTGLLALMAHAGLPVPAAEAEFPLFDQVLADIGDNQSIAESLSSFSAHMARVKQIEAGATFQSLVLLDELGRATDPEEGGALGVALLEQFRHIGAMTLATTHLLAMKVFGAGTPGVLNGSMGFSEETLEPTYVLRLGAPGKSAALSIAERLGVPAHIMERARQNLTGNERDIARFLSELHASMGEAERRVRDLEWQRIDMESRRARLERDYQRKDAERLRELERQTEQRVAKFDAESRKVLEQIAQMAEHRKAAESALRTVARTKREFREEMQEQVLAPASGGQEAPKGKLEVAEGVRVRLKGVRDLAVVRAVRGDRLEVQAGFMKMQVSREDVTEVLPSTAEVKSKLPVNVTFQGREAGPKWDVSYREINLIGQRAEEAIDQLDKFLDNASMASVDRVRVVHGFGMGVLRRAVADHLTRNAHVDRHYPAPPSEGGGGATIVELKAG